MPDRLGDAVGRGQRHDRRGQRGRAEQADAEQRLAPPSPTTGSSALAASFADVSGPVPPIAAAVAMMIDIEMNLAKIEPMMASIRSSRVVVGTDAPVGDGGRLVQLHVRRDRGADQGDDEEQELLVGRRGAAAACCDDHLAPVGVAEHHRRSGRRGTRSVSTRNTRSA